MNQSINQSINVLTYWVELKIGTADIKYRLYFPACYVHSPMHLPWPDDISQLFSVCRQQHHRNQEHTVCFFMLSRIFSKAFGSSILGKDFHVLAQTRSHQYYRRQVIDMLASPRYEYPKLRHSNTSDSIGRLINFLIIIPPLRHK